MQHIQQSMQTVVARAQTFVASMATDLIGIDGVDFDDISTSLSFSMQCPHF